MAMRPVSRFAIKISLVGGLTLLLISPALFFNYIVDPYGVFHETPWFHAVVPNERFVKMRYLVHHPLLYDSLVFGSSRVNTLDTSHLHGGTWYNLWANSATPEEYLQDIRFLLAHGMTMRNLLIGLDASSYILSGEDHQHELPSIMYPKDGHWLNVYATYLFTVPDYGVVKEAFYPRERIVYDYQHTGRALFVEREQALISNPAEHVATFKLPMAGPAPVDVNERIRRTIQAMADIRKIADERHIHLTVFVNPVHESLFHTTLFSPYRSFLKQLVGITDYVDFSGVNSITSDKGRYYEYSHYRPIVGDRIIASLFGTGATTPGFGFLVTRATVDGHLANLEQEFK